MAHCSQAGRGWRTLYVVFCQTITESCSTQAQLVTTLRSQPAPTFRWPRSAICVSRLKLEFLNFPLRNIENSTLEPRKVSVVLAPIRNKVHLEPSSRNMIVIVSTEGCGTASRTETGISLRERCCRCGLADHELSGDFDFATFSGTSS